MTVLTPTENDKSLIKKMHRALGRSSAAGSGTCFTLTGAHQLLLEEARTAYAVVDQNIRDHGDELAVLHREYAIFLGDDLLQKLDGILAVRLPECLVVFLAGDYFMQPSERRIGHEVEAAAFQERGDGKIERDVYAEFTDSAPD